MPAAASWTSSLCLAETPRISSSADRKSTRLNSSHSQISYAGFRLRKKIRDRGADAGLGREIAADRAGAFRRQQLRVEPVHRGGGLAGPLQRDAGLAGDRVGARIDL